MGTIELQGLPATMVGQAEDLTPGDWITAYEGTEVIVALAVGSREKDVYSGVRWLLAFDVESAAGSVELRSIDHFDGPFGKLTGRVILRPRGNGEFPTANDIDMRAGVVEEMGDADIVLIPGAGPAIYTHQGPKGMIDLASGTWVGGGSRRALIGGYDLVMAWDDRHESTIFSCGC